MLRTGSRGKKRKIPASVLGAVLPIRKGGAVIWPWGDLLKMRNRSVTMGEKKEDRSESTGEGIRGDPLT